MQLFCSMHLSPKIVSRSSNKPDIVSNVLIKQDSVLWDYSDGLPERFLSDFGNILSINGNGSIVYVIKPEEETNNC